MNVTQNLLLSLGQDLRQAGLFSDEQIQAVSLDGETPESFAEILANQNPERLEALIELLNGDDPDAARAAIEALALAADGKELPVDPLTTEMTEAGEMEVSDPTLANAAPEVIAAIADEWVRWLDNARTMASGVAVDPSQSQAKVVQSAEDSRSVVGKEPLDLLEMKLNLRQITAQPATVESSFAARLGDSLDSVSGSGRSDSETGDAAQRLGAAQQAAVQGALTSRAVTATSQSLGVPFGQNGWGDSVVEKVMWMSSQNLRGVEIRLDPAELGPLEIHIQSRGQEHQVQFVSQNAGVREALEAQVFKLRELFTQQGLELHSVSVGDSAPDGQQGRGNGSGLAANTGTSQSGLDAEPEVELLNQVVQQISSQRLVDFYI